MPKRKFDCYEKWGPLFGSVFHAFRADSCSEPLEISYAAWDLCT